MLNINDDEGAFWQTKQPSFEFLQIEQGYCFFLFAQMLFIIVYGRKFPSLLSVVPSTYKFSVHFISSLCHILLYRLFIIFIISSIFSVSSKSSSC